MATSTAAYNCSGVGGRRVERGSENVTITTLEAMAVALSVPVAILLTEPDANAPRPIPLWAGRKRVP